MKTKILNLYIFKESLIFFILGLSIFTFVLLIGNILKLMDIIAGKGVGFLDIIRLFLYFLPYVLVFTIPMAFLLALLLTFGRLSSENELIALKSSGLSLYQLTGPVAVLAVITFILTTFLSLFALPWGNVSLRKQLFHLVRTRAEVGINEGVFNDDFTGLIIYIQRRSSEDGKMEGIFLSDTRDLGTPTTVLAREGYLRSDPERYRLTLHLTDGSIHQISKDLLSYHQINFGDYQLKLTLGDGEEGGRKRYQDMTLSELREAAGRLRQEGQNFSFPLMELHKRFAIPFACLIFALIGVPLGIQPPRSGRSRSFSISLALLFVYYLLLVGGRSLGEKGFLPPFLAMWIGNIVFVAFGFVLFYRVANEKRLIRK
ncbi:MAG: LPS export ABC transporter permease LptF [Deltaproteobacteria bacterium]|nr:MAG: LPS export ABC transporter permease LptF [Deltaproteobacteria bacterium]